MRFTPLLLTIGLTGCASAVPAPPPPSLHQTGSEAGVAVTTPGGPETLPQWDRSRDGETTLGVPADLLFAKDSATLGPEAAKVLGQVPAEVRTTAGHVLVEGHADGDGDAAYNQDLSARRAAAVATWLTTRGVPQSAITTRGWGETRPAVEETDEAAKAKNRRVVVTVTPQTTQQTTQQTRRSQ